VRYFRRKRVPWTVIAAVPLSVNLLSYYWWYRSDR
jgi:hypothetical protein